MCGITGFFSSSPTEAAWSLIESQTQTLFHRGPDASDIWISSNFQVALGHRRLSIQDLTAAGAQPMHSRCRRYVIVFNGEIYNHNDLRGRDIFSDAERSLFRGRSDTETLLELISKVGLSDALQLIRGMFSFAVWDQKAGELSLVRDRMGEKPLYYCLVKKGAKTTLLFGSELKALKAHPLFDAEIDRGALAAYLRHSYVPDPLTIYKGVFKLPPGCTLNIAEHHLHARDLPEASAYWSIIEHAEKAKTTLLPRRYSESKAHLDSLINLAVEEQMLSDVPVGAFLSGGIDSSLIVSRMTMLSDQPVNTFSIGFSEAAFDEAPYAARIAKYLGTSHSELYVTAKDALDVIPLLPTIYDEPFSDSSQIPSYLLSCLTSRALPVALTGDGADELFCGYNRYSRSSRQYDSAKILPMWLRARIASTIQSLPSTFWNKAERLLEPLIPSQYQPLQHKAHRIASILSSTDRLGVYAGIISHWTDPERVLIQAREPDTFLNKGLDIDSVLNFLEMMSLQDVLMYLPGDILTKVDRAAMATSLETRAPFLDYRIVEYSLRLPTSFKVYRGRSKYILKDILADYMPRELFERPKRGFSVPVGHWLRGVLREWAEDLLDKDKMKQEGFFEVQAIHQKWEEHKSGKYRWDALLWDVLMFQQWYRAQLN